MRIDRFSYILLSLYLVTVIGWSIGDYIGGDDQYSLFIFRPEKSQTLRWYFHLWGVKVGHIVLLWVLVRITSGNLSKKHTWILKLMLGFAVYRLVEYIGFRYQMPIMVLTCITLLAITNLYFNSE